MKKYIFLLCIVVSCAYSMDRLQQGWTLEDPHPMKCDEALSAIERNRQALGLLQMSVGLSTIAQLVEQGIIQLNHLEFEGDQSTAALMLAHRRGHYNPSKAQAQKWQSQSLTAAVPFILAAKLTARGKGRPAKKGGDLLSLLQMLGSGNGDLAAAALQAELQKSGWAAWLKKHFLTRNQSAVVKGIARQVGNDNPYTRIGELADQARVHSDGERYLLLLNAGAALAQWQSLIEAVAVGKRPQFVGRSLEILLEGDFGIDVAEVVKVRRMEEFRSDTGSPRKKEQRDSVSPIDVVLSRPKVLGKNYQAILAALLAHSTNTPQNMHRALRRLVAQPCSSDKHDQMALLLQHGADPEYKPKNMRPVEVQIQHGKCSGCKRLIAINL